MLALRGVSTFYGKCEALCSVSLDVAEGEMVGIIGANGAGKTTMLRTICGLEHNLRGRSYSTARTLRLSIPPRAWPAAWSTAQRTANSSPT